MEKNKKIVLKNFNTYLQFFINKESVPLRGTYPEFSD